jgi:uncharacterized protein
VDEEFYLRQIARRIGASAGAVQREVRQLWEADLVRKSVRGNQVLYQANVKSPIFSEVRSLITKTAGMHDVVRGALLAFGERIRLAFIYGSVARREEHSNSDVDLVVIGKAGFGEIVSSLQRAQRALGREINPTVYPTREFQEKLRRGNHFLSRVLEEPKVFLIGDERELRGMVTKRLAKVASK